MVQKLNQVLEHSNLESRIMQITNDINELMSKKPRPYIYIGEKLYELKKLLGHGNFKEHLKEYILEFRSSRACEQWMKGYRKLAEAAKSIKFEDNVNLRELPITYEALNLLSTKATTMHCVEVIKLAHDGENITIKLVNKIIFGTKWANEKQIQEAIEIKLSTQGISLLSRGCQAGQADIVTSDTIYEVKHILTKTDVFRAIGQVLLYRECINPSANAVLVGVDGGIKSLIPFINQLGVKVELIE